MIPAGIQIQHQVQRESPSFTLPNLSPKGAYTVFSPQRICLLGFNNTKYQPTEYSVLDFNGRIAYAPSMKHPCSGIILAGGENKRFNGRNKAEIEIGGQQVINHLLSAFRPLFDEIILVTNDPLRYLDWDVIIVTDHFDQRSSLTGIHAGLFTATNPHALVTACDMPFVQPALLQQLTRSIEPHIDAIIPKTAKGYEPLLAIYSKRCLKPIESKLIKKQFQIQKVFKHVRLKTIDETQLLQYDSELISFFNINLPEDLTRAQKWLHRKNSTEI